MTRAIVRIVTRNGMAHYWEYDSTEEALAAADRLSQNDLVTNVSVFDRLEF